MNCTECGKEIAEWDFGEVKYCQMCWEKYCDDEYWKWFCGECPHEESAEREQP